MASIVVLAKPPVPGRVKTRLHPPLSYEEAAGIARASLLDTLGLARQLPADRRVLAWDDDELPSYARDFTLQRQCAGDLGDRLGRVFDLIEGPTVMVGMDTPQVTTHDLAPVFERWPRGVDAWFGPAEDGGFWALALAEPAGDLLRGVPMSTSDTGRILFDRLRDASLGVGMLPRMTDIDDIDSAALVADLAPRSRFAEYFAGLRTAIAA
jgi:glycosyltransferase A (GT-A) superfamily protein (DUF2064 family)